MEVILNSREINLIQVLLGALSVVDDVFGGYETATKFGPLNKYFVDNEEKSVIIEADEQLLLLDLLAMGNDISFWVCENTDSNVEPWMDLYQKIGGLD